MKSAAAGPVFAFVAMAIAGCAAQSGPPSRTGPEPPVSRAPSSDNPPTEDLDRVQAALLPPLLQPALRSSALVAEPRFDLTVANAPAAQVFLSMVPGTPYSMIIHPEVLGTVSVNLKDVTVGEALQLMREIFGYEYKIDGSRIYVLPAAIQTRVFTVSYLIGQRLGSSDIRVAMPGSAAGHAASGPADPDKAQAHTGAAGAQGDSSRIQTSTRNDFWAELTRSLQAVVGAAPGRSVAVNPQAGLVVVRAMPVELRQVEQYLNAIRASVQRQVVLEAKIVEVTLNDQFQSGINWALFAQSVHAAPGASTLPSSMGRPAGTAISGLPGGALFGLSLQTRNFDALLQFLESQGKVQVLSSPRIATLNNQKAVLKVGTDDFFVTGVASAAPVVTASGAPLRPFPEITVRPFFTGVALDVTPQVDADSSIILHIHPSVSSVTQSDRSLNLGSALGSVTLPLASSTVSESDSVLRAPDSNIVAIGGLMKVDPLDNGMAGLQGVAQGATLPGNRREPAGKKELVILIKPTVIHSERDGNEDLATGRERILHSVPRAGN